MKVCPAHGERSQTNVYRRRFEVGDLAVVRRDANDISSLYKLRSGEPVWSSPKVSGDSKGMGLARPQELVLVMGICVCSDSVWDVSVKILCGNGICGWIDECGIQPVV